LFDIYLWSLVGMTLFLVLAIGAHWSIDGTTGHLLFSAFAVLAGFMVWRATRARGMRPAGSARPSAGYVEHVGFTLVALFDAFLVITVLNAAAPVWLVVSTGVLIAVAGGFVLGRAKHALTYADSPHPTPSASRH
jgi:hypothetical protein